MKTALVLGGHGFIGHHMAYKLKKEGFWVRTIDIKEYPYGDLKSYVDDYVIGDLRDWDVCTEYFLTPKGRTFDEVYNFSAWMGGAGVVFTGENDAQIMHDSGLININVAEACRISKAKKIFFSSSACVYNQENQRDTENPRTDEASAFPAWPDSPYGWEKIFSEILWDAYARNYGLDVRLTRFHNIFGECFDDKTEILTDNGFKYFKDITFNDKFATRNPETGIVEYQEALAIQNYPYEGELYDIQTSDIDMLITPDHSMYVSTLTTKTENGVMETVKTPFQLKKIKDVVHARIFLRSDFSWESVDGSQFFSLPEIKQEDGRRIQSGKGLEKQIPLNLWLEFLGWYISEGSCFKTPTNYTVAITQSNKENVSSILNCVSAIGFKGNYDGNKINILSSLKPMFGKRNIADRLASKVRKGYQKPTIKVGEKDFKKLGLL